MLFFKNRKKIISFGNKRPQGARAILGVSHSDFKLSYKSIIIKTISRHIDWQNRTAFCILSMYENVIKNFRKASWLWSGGEFFIWPKTLYNKSRNGSVELHQTKTLLHTKETSQKNEHHHEVWENTSKPFSS